MPIVISAVLILACILPSFVIYEPLESGETVGLKLSIVLVLASFGIIAALLRIFGSWWRTRRLILEWKNNSTPIESNSVSLPIYKLRHQFPVFAVVGIRKPKLFIAEQVLNALDACEIEAVIQHELGHIAVHDNVKRLAMKICGDVIVLPIGRKVERNWADVSERAADDYAVEHGGRTTAIDLASALIKIARMIPDSVPLLPAVSYAMLIDDCLAIRIQRLLSFADQEIMSKSGQNRHYLIPIIVLAAELMLVLAADAGLLKNIHNVTESVLACLR